MLIAVLLMQWTFGVVACLASMPASVLPDRAICHADGGASPTHDHPANRNMAPACALCVLSTATMPEPPAALPEPTTIHAASTLLGPPCGPVPPPFFPAHPARGPPARS